MPDRELTRSGDKTIELSNIISELQRRIYDLERVVLSMQVTIRQLEAGGSA